jgi:hypothetical protein
MGQKTPQYGADRSFHIRGLAKGGIRRALLKARCYVHFYFCQLLFPFKIREYGSCFVGISSRPSPRPLSNARAYRRNNWQCSTKGLEISETQFSTNMADANGESGWRGVVCSFRDKGSKSPFRLLLHPIESSPGSNFVYWPDQREGIMFSPTKQFSRIGIPTKPPVFKEVTKCQLRPNPFSRRLPRSSAGGPPTPCIAMVGTSRFPNSASNDSC